MTSQDLAQEHESVRADARCLNCGAELSGRFCANCGQAAGVHVPSGSELMHEAIEGITHSDSRLWRTLKLLWLSPGKLTQEFVAGRRARYLPPIRLYLVLSVIFFLVASLSQSHGRVAELKNGHIQYLTSEADCGDIQFEPFGNHVWQQRLRHGCEAVIRDSGAGLMHVVAGAMPKAMFLFLPLVAFLHMLMYWRPRHRYAEHLLFFLHVHAYFFSLMTLMALSAIAGSMWPRSEEVLGYAPLLLGFLPLYTLVAMKRVFGGTWLASVFKASALLAVYLVVLSITLASVFVYAVLQL